MLVALNEGIGREAKELLLLLALPSQERPTWFTSDGAIHFAPMIVAGLVKVTHGRPAMAGSWQSYEWPAAYKVDLTDKGAAVVAAWKTGDPTALKYAQARAILEADS
jgi:hypothetical protein